VIIMAYMTEAEQRRMFLRQELKMLVREVRELHLYRRGEGRHAARSEDMTGLLVDYVDIAACCVQKIAGYRHNRAQLIMWAESLV
jgi:hypothetical protein